MSKFLLILNDMRSVHIETPTIVVAADREEDLEQFMEDCQADAWPYRDGHWSKVFKQGSPLEWFNPPCEHFGHGIVPVAEVKDLMI